MNKNKKGGKATAKIKTKYLITTLFVLFGFGAYAVSGILAAAPAGGVVGTAYWVIDQGAEKK